MSQGTLFTALTYQLWVVLTDIQKLQLDEMSSVKPRGVWVSLLFAVGGQTSLQKDGLLIDSQKVKLGKRFRGGESFVTKSLARIRGG